ncbi:hypothetical protein NAEX_01383 [Nannocystis exedens]|nr:hypothetical protein NAEX_01383 [Nannocystis exedens]
MGDDLGGKVERFGPDAVSKDMCRRRADDPSDVVERLGLDAVSKDMCRRRAGRAMP